MWDPDVCIQCGKCAMVCPHGVIRIKVYDAAAPRRRSGDLQVLRRARPRVAGPEVHDPGRAGGLHRLRHLRRRLPGQEQVRDAAQGDQHEPAAAAARAGARELGLLPDDPGDGPPPASRSARIRQQQVQQPLFEFSGACAGCGETPYLKLVDPALRRPHDRRQRHGLLVDLRRQPADDALDAERRRARPGLVQLAVRGQRRVRPRLSACRSTSRRSSPRELLQKLGRQRRRRSGARDPDAPTRRTKPTSTSSASASPR